MTKIRFASAGESGTMADIHRASFPLPWSNYQIERMFAVAGTFAFFAGEKEAQGMIITRAVGDQSDLLTIAVHPDFRRRGIGRQLVATAMAEAQKRGAEQMFLEVAEDNHPAVNLYGNFGFKILAHRKDYYTLPENRRTDALLMGCKLTLPKAPVS